MGAVFSKASPEAPPGPGAAAPPPLEPQSLKRATRPMADHHHHHTPAAKRQRRSAPSAPPVGKPANMASSTNAPRDGRTANKGDDRKEDIRGTVVEDAPVLAKYILRAKRNETGGLSLDTGGKPLYTTPDFLETVVGSASVLPPETEDAETTAPAPGSTNGDVNSSPQTKQRPQYDRAKALQHQSNMLGSDLRRDLRKRTAVFPRTEESASLWNEKLFDTDELTGAFGVAEKRRIDLRGKLYLAPLTTVGNLPFRRVMKRLGADVTCGEMAMAGNLLQAQNSEWALLRRHDEEDLFGVQLAGSNVETISRASEMIGRECSVDFIELNCGCPIDLVFNRGGGCSLMNRRAKLTRLVWTVSNSVDVPVGVKMRTGVSQTSRNAHVLIGDVAKAGAQWVTVHGRSRKQRYSKLADWDYITQWCAPVAQQARTALLGNGDVYNWRDVAPYLAGGEHENAGISTVMIARGALIKPWVFTEIKERRDWDIRSGERLELYKQFAKFGLEHWGADTRGVETTRRFLLEWLSFLYRYVPIGIVEGGADTVMTMNHRAPFFRGRDDLETLLGSPQSKDWMRITEMLLGPARDKSMFKPKHKSNAWDGGGVAVEDSNG